MFDELLIMMGLKPDPALFAGRPDRESLPDEVEAPNYEGKIPWAGMMLPGTAEVGDTWGEWTLKMPSEVVGEEQEHSPPLSVYKPEYTPLSPSRRGEGRG